MAQVNTLHIPGFGKVTVDAIPQTFHNGYTVKARFSTEAMRSQFEVALNALANSNPARLEGRGVRNYVYSCALRQGSVEPWGEPSSSRDGWGITFMLIRL